MKKTGLLLAGAFLISILAANAIDIAPTAPGLSNMYGFGMYNSGTSNTHEMQMLNMQRREFENSVNYKKEQRRQQADEQVQNTFEQIKDRTNNAQGNLQFVQTQDGRIIIKRVN